MMCNSDLKSVPNSIGDAVDIAVLSSLESAQTDGEPDLIVDLIDLYLEDAPRRLADMWALLAERDELGLRRAAHSLKGSSATLGAGPMARLCEGIENVALDHSSAAGANLLNELCQEFAFVRHAFLTERHRRTTRDPNHPMSS
jgi:HPt (histidine-containing phosphotransfer) domain-containing protein